MRVADKKSYVANCGTRKTNAFVLFRLDLNSQSFLTLAILCLFAFVFLLPLKCFSTLIN